MPEDEKVDERDFVRFPIPLNSRQVYPKLCIYCEHFGMDEAYDEPGYSSYTPGYTVNAKILCRKRYWVIDNESDNVRLYRKHIESAGKCVDFTPFKSYD